MKLVKTALFLTLVSTAAYAQINAGTQAPVTNLPFTMTPVATFDFPWRLAFLPDGRMLVTEKVGHLDLVTQAGVKTDVGGVPPVYYQGQNGLLGVFLSPHYATDQSVYLTYDEPGEYGGGLTLARAKLTINGDRARLEGLQTLWRQLPKGKGGQDGAQIAFAPDGNSLFLTVGDRQRFTPAQDINQPEGKILHLTLDGKPAADNPNAGKTGAASIPLIDPAADTEKAKTAPVVSTYTFTGPNLTPSETWSEGHGRPSGLAFAPREVEQCGPMGGDELNLIQKGKNYGWPLVSYGNNYNGVPIAKPPTRTDLVEPVIYWVPIIAPGNLMFYHGTQTFPQWNGNALMGGMATMTLNRFIRRTVKAREPAFCERWNVGRVRDVEDPAAQIWKADWCWKTPIPARCSM